MFLFLFWKKSSLKATRKSENKRQNSKQKVSQQLCNNLHQPQDESSLSEASLEERYGGLFLELM